MRTRRAMLRLIVLPAAVLAIGASAATAHATYRGGVGLIAFPMGDGNAVDVYTTRPDGSDLRQVTEADGWDACPVWSPDGKQIAFCSNRTGTYEIWLMNADGSGQRQLTHVHGDALFPSFAPDGKRIVFQASSSTPSQDNVFVVDVATGKLTRLTDAPGNDDYPVFSPDGRTIAFVSHRKAGPAQIWLMDADGRHPRQLTHDDVGKDELPDWSPDGSQIAYQAGGHIWVMRSDGSAQRRLTFGRNGSPFDLGPRWSPDGRQLTFLREVGPLKRAFVMNADGTHAHPLHPVGTTRQLLPAWQSLR